jgi:hypothetical protein
MKILNITLPGKMFHWKNRVFRTPVRLIIKDDEVKKAKAILKRMAIPEHGYKVTVFKQEKPKLKVENPKAKNEAPKSEAPKSEAPKAKTEAPKTEAPKTEAPKAEASKAKVETSKAKDTKANTSKAKAENPKK